MDILTVMGIIAAGLISLGVIYHQGLKPIYRFFRRIEDMHQITVLFPIWQASVDECLKELQPNNGHSLRDDISYLRSTMDDHVNDTTKHN